MKIKHIAVTIILFSIFPFALSGANISIPELKLLTRGVIEDSTLNLNTRGDMTLRIEGGYKFGGQLDLGINSNSLNSSTAEEALNFKSASVISRNPFQLPLSFTYFVGGMDTFCSGKRFPKIFGTKNIASKYSGYIYFKDNINYDGIHTVDGTGFKIETSGLSNWFYTSLSTYQDSMLGTGRYSSDLNFMLNTEYFKMESFVGASYPVSDYGYYRGGMMLYYTTNKGGEFFTQIGIPRFDPMVDDFTIENFYFLFEPRVIIDPMSIILTVFLHPKYYMQTTTNETGSVDVNVDFGIGNVQKSPFSGGIEGNFAYLTHEENKIRVLASPYFSLVSSGVIWDFKINTKVYPFKMSNLFEGFIGIRAEF